MFNLVLQAQKRISSFIEKTPILSDENLNKELGAQIFFKMENCQKTNSFKARGAFNAILAKAEIDKKMPEKIVVQSSGNHAQAIAYACKTLGSKALIYMTQDASPKKIQAAQSWGGEVILLEKRSEVNKQAQQKANEGYFFIHPSANAEVICGQGTAALEAIEEKGEFDAIFTPCGGGGLASGTFIVAKELSPKAKIFTCEPANANDVAISVRENKIFAFENSPNSVADGARTLATSEICFQYLKQHNAIFEISEEEIIFWQKKLMDIFSQKIEPTCALAIGGVARYLKENSNAKNEKILVIISGGNI